MRKRSDQSSDLEMKRVLHVIGGSLRGGAQRVLLISTTVSSSLVSRALLSVATAMRLL